MAASGALAQSGGSSAAKKAAPEPDKPAPTAKVAGSFGNWTLLCGKETPNQKERCSLVLPLVEKESQKLVFRVIVTYGPQSNLVLRVDGPTGVALQRGLEFSPDTKKVYRMPFQTCLPMGCKALLLIPEDLKKELAASKQGAITVYALNGKAVQTVAALNGFAEGMAALDKHIAGK
jgi:invasion protein IalB